VVAAGKVSRGVRIAVAASDERDACATLRLVRGASEAEQLDEALARAFLDGDDLAFSALVRRHERAVLALVRRYAEDEDSARDLAQRAFLKAFEAARRSRWLRRRDALPFRSWLLRVALNLGKNHARDARRWRRAPVEAAEEAAPIAAVGAADLERQERTRAVRAAVMSLPRRQREVLTLRIDAELPFAEIARVLGTSENAAKVSFHHAVKRLRDAVAGEDV
jgi:RNA polymerase sigma-70 factor, ECF subfamily